MKKFLTYLVVIMCCLSGSLATAGSGLDTYWPMHDGDSKMFEYVFYGMKYDLTEWVSNLGNGEFEITYDGPAYYEVHNYGSNGSTLTLNHDQTADYELTFNSPVTLLTDVIIQNGGTLSSTVQGSIMVDGSEQYQGTLTFSTTVTKAGTVMVPAGYFNDCRNILVKMSMPGRGSFSFMSGTLAPDVGFIKMVNADHIASQLDLGTVGGIDVGILSTGVPRTSIKAPINGQRIVTTNNIVAVAGSVGGYIPGVQVFYQVNSDPWTNAVVAGTNWSGSVPVWPGTNSLSAYAVDSVGRTSSVVTVKFQYVVAAVLSVQTVGKGALTPNTTNAMLELGRAYTLTAKPAKGYAFTNWTGWADGAMVLNTNRAALNFVMQSNLVLTATFVDVAKPVLKLTAPVAKQRWSNEVFTVRGTVTDYGPVTAVNYQINGGDWTNDVQTVNGCSNWTACVTLMPGTNTLRACAVDAAGNRSLTNTVNFTYVLSGVLQVGSAGRGTLSPNYNHALLEIGRGYTLTAKAIPGYAFTNWTGTVNGAVVLSTNRAALNFVMQSNLVLTATFVDVQRPLLAITSPAARHTVSNALLNATCRATDNTGVVAVYYQLNGGDWESDATSAEGTNWILSGLALTPGTNSLRAFAVDAAGNASLTNTIDFSEVVPPVTGFASASLAGLVGRVVGALNGDQLETPFDLSLGTSTFAISTTDTNDDMAVGNYTCTVLDSNTVRFTTLVVSPPAEAGGTWSRIFVFTTNNTCVFTNDFDGSLGTITFSQAARLMPATAASLTVQHWDPEDNRTNITVITGGVFTNYSNFGTGTQAAQSWGNCAALPFSPVSAMLVMSYTDPADAGEADYTELTFAATNAGSWFCDAYDSDGNVDHVSTGSFEILDATSPPAGNAPVSLAGKAFKISAAGIAFNVCFGDFTYTVCDADTNHENTLVNDYGYVKTGANTGLLSGYSILPPGYASQTNLDVRFALTFTSSTGGSGDNATFSISTANNYAPTSLAGRTITLVGGGKTLGTGVVNHDGTFTFAPNGGLPETTACTYAQYSPLGGMLVLTDADGWSSYVQFQFASATTGSWYEKDYDNLDNDVSLADGTFTMK